MSKIFNSIVNGDCLSEIKKIPDKTFDLVFADPPYNMQIGESLNVTNYQSYCKWKLAEGNKKNSR